MLKNLKYCLLNGGAKGENFMTKRGNVEIIYTVESIGGDFTTPSSYIQGFFMTDNGRAHYKEPLNQHLDDQHVGSSNNKGSSQRSPSRTETLESQGLIYGGAEHVMNREGILLPKKPKTS